MAEILETHEFRCRGAAKYPWESWLDGRIWRLKSGEDFASKSTAFVTGVYSAARKRGVQVRTTHDGDTVTFQAVKEASPKEKRLADLKRRGAA